MSGPRASSRGGFLDLAALTTGAGAMLLGVVAAARDWSQHVESTAALALFGQSASPDPSLRLGVLPWALGLALAAGVIAIARWALSRRDPFQRRHARRPLALLAVGATILDAAYLLDSSAGGTLPHAARAVAIDPLYALAGFFVVGAAWRLRSLSRPLPPTDPEAIL